MRDCCAINKASMPREGVVGQLGLGTMTYMVFPLQTLPMRVKLLSTVLPHFGDAEYPSVQKKTMLG